LTLDLLSKNKVALMTPALCALLAQYNQWMNQRLFEAAGQLPEPVLFEDRGAFFGSLYDTMNHILVADLLWLHRLVHMEALATHRTSLAALPQPTSLRQRMAGSLHELAALRTQVDAALQAVVGCFTEPQLAQPLRYSTVAGQAQEKNLGLLLMHLFNHQTHHRGQATTLLFQAGVDIGVTDLNALVPSTI
jgi:uncharacterized damage-inducible protein DinB